MSSSVLTSQLTSGVKGGNCNASSSSDIVVSLTITSCSLSILGAFAIFTTWFIIPEIRNSTRKFVMLLTVADLLTATGYIVSSIAHFHGGIGKVCFAQSIITTLSSLVSFFYTVVIAIHIFGCVVFGTVLSLKFYVAANIFSWLLPVSIICAAAITDKLGSSGAVGTGPWCWVRDDLPRNQGIIWRFVTGKGWEWQCYLYTISLYVLLKLYLYLKRRNRYQWNLSHNLREEDRNFLYVPLILLFLRIWGSMRFVFSSFGLANNCSLQNASQVLIYFQALGDPGQAFGNFILFCVCDKTVRTRFIGYMATTKAARLCSKPEERNLRQNAGSASEGDHSISSSGSSIGNQGHRASSDSSVEQTNKKSTLRTSNASPGSGSEAGSLLIQSHEKSYKTFP